MLYPAAVLGGVLVMAAVQGAWAGEGRPAPFFYRPEYVARAKANAAKFGWLTT